jgi:pimeloyl-ACP methyl ester carboxylesterase
MLTSVVTNHPTTSEERIELSVRAARVFAGSLAPFDEQAARQVATETEARAINPDAAYNHGIAPPFDRRQALQAVTAPTLVIHGTEDPILPYEHGVATAKAIPGARLHTIEKMGHDRPRVAFAEIAETIRAHITAPH